MLKQYLDLRTQDFMDKSYGKTRERKEEILDEYREYLKGFGKNVNGKVIISYDIAALLSPLLCTTTESV